MLGCGKPFTLGDPRAGRKPGSENKTTKEARLIARELVSDPTYLQNLRKRLQEGQAGTLEEVLWRYAYGPPPDHEITILGEATKSGEEREGSADPDGRCACLCPQSALQRRSYRAGRDMGA